VGWILGSLAGYLACGLAWSLVGMVDVGADGDFEPGDILESLLIWPVLLVINVRRRLLGRSAD
jgi:hypothetical protein